MTHLLTIPENVFIQHVFPCLDHNDLLRLRRVSKQTKAFANAYLCMPQPGHQGNWELEIDSSKEDQTLEAFLQKRLLPPSRLHIVNTAKEPSEQKSFFEDEHLEEFMKCYSKYVTTLRLDKLFFPFTSAKEIRFYGSLINLKELCCSELITVGGVVQFEDKTRRAEGSFLIRPTWSKKLKILELFLTDCMDSMWNFINGLSNNLEDLSHPFRRRDYSDIDCFRVIPTNFAPVQQLIERRGGMKCRSKLVYNWNNLLLTSDSELLRMFAICRDNGVVIKTTSRPLADILFEEKERIEDEATGTRAGRVLSEISLLLGSVIHTLNADVDNAVVFPLELPALEAVTIDCPSHQQQMPRDEYPEWPNLKSLGVIILHPKKHLHFLDGGLKLLKLENLMLVYSDVSDALEKKHYPIPRNLGVSCGNVKILEIIECPADSRFFLGLWKQLPLLEDVTLTNCFRLTNKSFVGNGVGGSGPAFLNLKKLKHLTIYHLEEMPRITDAVFRNVFRHLKLASFRLHSSRAINSFTVSGIKELLTGPFEKTIQKLDLAQLQLEDVSEEELKQVVSCFRCSKMI